MWARGFHQISTLALCLSATAVFTLNTLHAQGIESLTTVANAADLPQSPAGMTANFSSLSPETQGDLLMVRGRYAAALDAYQHGSPQSAVLANKIGVAYHHLFALGEARKHYEMAIRLNPRYAEAFNNLAAVYHGEHNYKQAEKTYKQSLKLAPNSALTYKNLGTAYLSDQKYKQGSEAYRKALALNPNIFGKTITSPIEDTGSRAQRMDVDYYLAKTYATAGNSQQALLCLHRAVNAGFNDRRRLTEDKDFTQLRATPEFQQLIAQIPPSRMARHTDG